VKPTDGKEKGQEEGEEALTLDVQRADERKKGGDN